LEEKQMLHLALSDFHAHLKPQSTSNTQQHFEPTTQNRCRKLKCRQKKRERERKRANVGAVLKLEN
jgi:hypothetical protein